MPRVSVVIPTFNRSGLIGGAIQSVIDQTYRDLEIIICDDCSTDDTVGVVKSIQAHSPLPVIVDVLPHKLGTSAARNRGVFLASGELIAFLDSDDAWWPEKLEKQIAFLDNNPGFIGVGCKISRREVDPAINGVNGVSYELDRSNELFELLYRCYIITSCFVVKKDALILAGLFDLSLQKTQDRDLWWRLPRLGRIGYINQVLVNYLAHVSSISQTLNTVTGKTYIPIIEKTVWHYRDKLTAIERRKILSNAHLLVAVDASQGNAFFLSVWHALRAMSYGSHIKPAIRLIVSNTLKLVR